MAKPSLEDLVASPGKETPARFIIAAHERSASTLAIRSLDEHPYVQAVYEAFNRSFSHRAQLPLWGNRRWSEHEDPVAYTKRYLFRAPQSAKARVQGFKVFYQHCRETELQASLWRYLEEDKAIRVILMRRENLAKAFISRCRALNADKWNVSSSSLTPEGYNTPFEVNIETCIEYIARKRRHIATLKEAFATHPHIEITYEQMTGQYDGSIARLWDFLGVPPLVLDQPVRKLSYKPLQEVVINYDELKAALAASAAAAHGWLE